MPGILMVGKPLGGIPHRIRITSAHINEFLYFTMSR